MLSSLEIRMIVFWTLSSKFLSTFMKHNVYVEWLFYFLILGHLGFRQNVWVNTRVQLI